MLRGGVGMALPQDGYGRCCYVIGSLTGLVVVCFGRVPAETISGPSMRDAESKPLLRSCLTWQPVFASFHVSDLSLVEPNRIGRHGPRARDGSTTP